MDLQMKYRPLGNSGLRVSHIGYGNMSSGWSADTQEVNNACIEAAIKAGINLFDTAEVYGTGQAQKSNGISFKALGKEFDREEMVITDKFFFKDQNTINNKGLGRKHLIQSCKRALKLQQLEYLDIIYCHRPSTIAPLEETCRAMDWLIEKGYANYWGTSEHSPETLVQIYNICDRLGLTPPIVEQCVYNMLDRDRMEKDYLPLFDNYGLGITAYSPLAQGILTGKYNSGEIPQGSRFELHSDWVFFYNKYLGPDVKEKNIEKIQKLTEIGERIEMSLPQLALCWVTTNPDVTSMLLGASSVQQLSSNLQALSEVDKLTPVVLDEIEDVLNNAPNLGLDWVDWKPKPSRLGRGTKKE